MPRVGLRENVREQRLIEYAYVLSPFFGSVTYAHSVALAVDGVSVGVFPEPPGRGICVEHKHEFGFGRALKSLVYNSVKAREVVLAVTRPHRTRTVHVVYTAVGQTHKVYIRAVHARGVIYFENGFLFAKIHHRRDFFAVYDKLNSAVFLYYAAFGQFDFGSRDFNIFSPYYVVGVKAVCDDEFFRVELQLITVGSEIIGNVDPVSDYIVFADDPLRRLFTRHKSRYKPVFHYFVFVGGVFASEIYSERNIA